MFGSYFTAPSTKMYIANYFKLWKLCEFYWIYLVHKLFKHIVLVVTWIQLKIACTDCMLSANGLKSNIRTKKNNLISLEMFSELEFKMKVNHFGIAWLCLWYSSSFNTTVKLSASNLCITLLHFKFSWSSFEFIALQWICSVFQQINLGNTLVLIWFMV